MRFAILGLSAVVLACSAKPKNGNAPSAPPEIPSRTVDAGTQPPSLDAGTGGAPEDAGIRPDAGVLLDGGALPDAGGPMDAGTPIDAGTPVDDGGSSAQTCPALPDGGVVTVMPEIPSAACLAEPVSSSHSELCDTIRARFSPPWTMAIPMAESPQDACTGVGSSDGEGHLAIGEATSAPEYHVHWSVMTQDGQRIGEFGTIGTDGLMAEPHGFQTSEYILGSANEYAGPLLVYESDTSSAKTVEILDKVWPVAQPAIYAPDPLGGAVAGVWRYDWNPEETAADLGLYIWAGDADGQPRPGFPRHVVSRPTCQPVSAELSIMRGTRGDALVIWAGEPFFGPGTLAAQWFDASGEPETDLFQALIPPGNRELAPLADGRIAVKVQGQWAYAFSPGQTVPEPAPCWLQPRPNTKLQLIHGLRAYALLSAGPCDRALEVVDGNGQSCGTFALDDAAVWCSADTVSIGADGTVLEQGPSTTAALSNGWTVQVCNERWWPSLLR